MSGLNTTAPSFLPKSSTFESMPMPIIDASCEFSGKTNTIILGNQTLRTDEGEKRAPTTLSIAGVSISLDSNQIDFLNGKYSPTNPEKIVTDVNTKIAEGGAPMYKLKSVGSKYVFKLDADLFSNVNQGRKEVA